ncbi:MAG: hypothetical protein HY718_21475, partial [Planctomycetes bacterium]|nr:hypothetical protein [Planctomycetota bacterium]
MCRRRTPWWLIHASFFTGLLVAAAGGGAPVAVADGSAAAADGPAAVAEGSASADAAAGALPAGWQRREVHWRLPGERKVRAIREPGDRPVPTRDRWHPVRPASRTRTLSAGEREAAARLLRERTVAAAPEAASGPESVSVLIIHSPPIDGFVPHVALLTTNARKSRDYWDASPSLSVLGDYTVANPTLQYGFGIFDTGAGVSVLSFANSALFGLLSSLTYNTGKVVTIGGVTGSVTAWVSQPIGLWMDGLEAINPATLLLDT